MVHWEFVLSWPAKVIIERVHRDSENDKLTGAGDPSTRIDNVDLTLSVGIVQESSR